MRIGIIGCGNIANIISKKIKISATYDLNSEKCMRFKGKICRNIDELIENSDLIIEAASINAVKEYAEKIVKAGKSILIMSVGALIDENFRKNLIKEAEEKGVKIYITSGAIGGIDLIKSAKVGRIKSVKLKTYKNAGTLGLDVNETTLIFHGKASEAIKRYPKSVNVAVLLSIVSGMDIDVEVYAQPDIEENIHVIEISGEFGEANIEIKNRPSKDNPKTSYLAALSLVSLIDSLNDSLQVM